MDAMDQSDAPGRGRRAYWQQGLRGPRQLLRPPTISRNALLVSVLGAYLQPSVGRGGSQFFLRQTKRLK